MRFGSGLRLGLAAFGLVAATSLAAQQPDVNARTVGDLAGFCAMEDKSFCYGFLSGAGQFYQQLVAHDDARVQPFVCPDREVSREEAVALFVAWVDANPGSVGEPAVDGVFRAWQAAFPCT